MFTFFLSCYRHGILTFCGSSIDVEFDIDGPEGKFCFRKFENGHYKGDSPIQTRHPNITKGVITGKKGWGLWVDQWTDGIVDWSFTEEEILGTFKEHNIKIPESFLNEFYNKLDNKRRIRNQKELERIRG